MATINGTGSSDSLAGTSSADTINGYGGNDSLKGGGAADRLDGGAGTDTAMYSDSSAGVTVNLDNGTGIGGTAQGDTLVNIENLWGSAYNDQLLGDDRANVLTGLGGNDLLKGGGGADTLSGDDGNDTLKGGGGSDILNGGAGVDTADFSEADTYYTISLTTGRAAIGYHPNDVPDWAITDRLSGIENVIGTAYGDYIIGDSGGNVLEGRDGNDSLDGRGGADTMYGGEGHDHFWVNSAADLVVEHAGEGGDAVHTSISYTIAPGNSIELLNAEDFAGAISLTGNELVNYITGNGSANVIDGGGGADAMWGEAGNDTYIVDNALDNPNDWLGEGFDTVVTSVDYTVTYLSEIELIQTSDASGTADIDLGGNPVAQTLIGNNGANVVTGGEGADTLLGNGGNDLLRGDQHADRLDGGAGFDFVSYENATGPLQVNLAAGAGLADHAQGDVLVGIEGVVGSPFADVITGDAGGNSLDGRGGADLLTGGAGEDIFVFRAGQAGGDTVVDFEGAGVAGGDLMQFAGYGAGATFTQVDAAHWQVSYNGNAQQDVITFQNAPVFVAGDFTFV